MQITLYKNFSKKRNSTKQPTGGTTANVVFKNGCSTENPVFLIDGVDLDVNYIGFNSGFYFVDDIVLGNNNIYELHCSIDVLATWKSLIGSYYTFIERAESDYDTNINDKMLSASQNIAYIAKSETEIGYSNKSCYVFRVASYDGPHIYLVEDSRALGLLYDPVSYGLSASDIQTIVAGIGMSALDCSQYILSTMWFPLDHTDFPAPNEGHTVTSITLGFWNVDVSQSGFTYYEILSVKPLSKTVLNIPSHQSIEDFRVKSPTFSKYSMWLPGVGTVELNAIDAGRSGSKSIKAAIDMISGAITYTILDTTTDAIIATYDGFIGVPYPYVSTNLNGAGIIESALGTIGGAIAAYESGGVSAAAGAAASGAVDVVNSIGSRQGTVNCGGANRSAIIQNPKVVVSWEMMQGKQFPGSRAGRPLYEYRTINALSGFIKCGAASIDIPGAAPNKDAVNSYLNSGFYYE